MKVDLSCPIELWEYALPTKENPACSFTFFNLSERLISSIQITVTCYDDKDAVISRRVERPMALEAQGRAPFTVALPTDGLEVDSIDLVIDKAWYEDGNEWRRAQEARLVDYEPNELPPNRKLEQLRYVAGTDAVGYPSDQRNVWICVCGRVNPAEERECRRCERDKADVFKRFSPQAVQAAIDKREKELEEKARIAREEASRQEFIRQERVRRIKRNRRVRTTVVCVVLALVASAYLFVILGLPELRYQTALSALATGDYTGARSAFLELAEYRDARQKIRDCDFLQASEYARSRDEALIDTGISMLREFGSHPGVAGQIDEATYQKALLRMERNDYASASEIFGGILGYRDSTEMRKQCDYQVAARIMAAGDYATAAEHFAALGNYLDAAVQAKECTYRPAVALMMEGRFEEAARMFQAIVGYSDASEQYQQAVYMGAIRAQNAGEYEEAAERFLMLGNYGDANTQMKHSIYLAAGVQRDSGKYELAKDLYTAIADYEDSVEQAKECLYLPAVALMAGGEYLDAAETFREIFGYKDAEELFKKSLYTQAVLFMEDKDFVAATSLLEQIPAYSDAAKLLSEAKYKRAGQLEDVGDLDAAIAAFAALGAYSDAEDRAKAARYAKADRLFDAGDYDAALAEFQALENFSNATTRVKDCAYQQALLLLDADDLQGAYDALMAIPDHPTAAATAQEVAYTIGDMQFQNGNLGRAAQAFLLAGKYKDAAERRKEAIYQEALNVKEETLYQTAASLFDSIADYKDAKEQRDESYDLWLSDFLATVEMLYDAQLYDLVLVLYFDMDLETIPKKYAQLKTIYYESNYIMARWLISIEEPLEAYRYLLACDGFKNSKTMLDKNIYKLLGTWETEDGAKFAFFLNGTCILNGERFQYNMKDAYGILVGKTREEFKRTYSFSSYNNDNLTLTEDATGKRFRFKRVKQAEVAPPEDIAKEAELSEAQMDLLRELEMEYGATSRKISRVHLEALKLNWQVKQENGGRGLMVDR